MHPRHLILAAFAAVLLLATGCAGRSQQVEADELRAENLRMSSELDNLLREANLLKEQRDKAREELVRQREQNIGLSEQLRRSLASGSLPTGISVTDEGSLSLDQDFAFAKGSAELNEAGLASVGQLASLLNSGEHAQTNIIVTGHTDSTPVVRAETKARFGDNWGLSAMRAAAVIRALQQSGIDAKRLRGAFFGEHAPRKANTTNENKAANRRVEIFVSL